MTLQLINIIFGMKVRQARMDAGMTLSEFAQAADLSASYVTEIEKGRKYPRADKIMKIAEALDKSYDDLVSIKLPPSLTYLESMLSSDTIQHFPFTEFGFEPGDLVTLLTREPDKASALLHAILEMTRRYDLQKEEFLRAILRSYQEIHENYFPDLEESAVAFLSTYADQYELDEHHPLDLATLRSLLQDEFGYEIDDSTISATDELANYRSIVVPGEQPRLYINDRLYSRQVKFLLAREIGYQYLGLQERSWASTPDNIETFQQLLNDYRAAYFGGALLMPREPFLQDVRDFFTLPAWTPAKLLSMLTEYNVTPEMLLYRLSELVPQFFGLKIHFLRFHHTVGTSDYRLVKQLNLNRLLVPSGIGLFEHYCRRWLSVRLLQECTVMAEPKTAEEMPIDAQISRFLETGDEFLSLGFARRLVLSPHVYSSVVVGFRLNSQLQNRIRFVSDPTLPRIIINETCERCPLTKEECLVRAAEPTILKLKEAERARQQAITELSES